MDTQSGSHPARRLTVLVALCVPVLLALTAEPAAAHGNSTNYVSAVANVQPTVPGLDVSTTSDGSYLIITNRTGKTVIVLGYENEAYLKITQHGVWQNTLSPATYLNAELVGDLPNEVSVNAQPKWQQISDSNTYRFHDHRIHWNGNGRPSVVNENPGEPHLIANWTVHLLVGDTPVSINGTLSWSPSGIPAMYLVLAVTCGGLIAVFIFAIVLDARRSREDEAADLGDVPESHIRPTVPS